jgi:hypothetical protein
MSMDRSLQGAYGPRFFRAAVNDGDSYDFFEHRIDSRNSVGPRIATKADKQNYPKLWANYQASMVVEPAIIPAAPAPAPVAAKPVLEEMPAFLKRKKGK